MKKLLLILIIISVIVPTLVNASTVDSARTTFSLGTADLKDTTIYVIQWIIGIIVILCVLSILITPIIMTKLQKEANIIILNHYLKPKENEEMIIEREKIILKYNYSYWSRGAGCLLLILLIFAIQDIVFFISYIIIFFLIFFSSRILKKRMKNELIEFDKKNPEVKNKMSGYLINKITVTPEFKDEYNQKILLKNKLNKIFAVTIILLIISLFAWSIVIFTPCCATDLTF